MKRAFLAIAVVALFQAGTAMSAGPFDGEWKGTVTALGRCGVDTMTGTVTDGNAVLFQNYGGMYPDILKGTVNPDGSFSGSWPNGKPVAGKFQGNTFSATFPSGYCGGPRDIHLERVK